MVNYCAVLYCKSRKRINKYSIFQVPKSREISELWSKIVTKVNKKPTIVKYLCELHFTSDDIIRNYSGRWNMPIIEQR